MKTSLCAVMPNFDPELRVSGLQTHVGKETLSCFKNVGKQIFFFYTWNEMKCCLIYKDLRVMQWVCFAARRLSSAGGRR